MDRERVEQIRRWLRLIEERNWGKFENEVSALCDFAERHIEAPPCQHHHADGTQCMKPSVPGSLNCPEHDHDEPDLVETVALFLYERCTAYAQDAVDIMAEVLGRPSIQMPVTAWDDMKEADKQAMREQCAPLITALQGRILGEGVVAVPVEELERIEHKADGIIAKLRSAGDAPGP